MKKRNIIHSALSLSLTAALCLSMAACGGTQPPADSSAASAAPAQPAAVQPAAEEPTSTALPVKALHPKQVDENPYMAKSDANIHHDGYNTDSTDEILPLGIYPEINVSYEKTNANASPAIYFDNYGHAVVPLLGGIAIAVDLSLQPTGDFYLNLFFCYLCVTYAGILKAFFLMLKVFGAVSCMFLMTLSTPSHELFSVLHKIHCPSLFTELMHMIYRYIFILLEVQHNMQISAEARLGFCDFRTSCYSFGQIAANLFIVALKKANAYYDAMEARCYDGTLCFLEEKKKLPLPYIIASGTFFLFLVVLWLFIR